MIQNLLVSYASDFSSFLLIKLENEYQKINKVILFGSVTRGEADKKSDIDIFVDVTTDSKKIEKIIEKAKKEFYESIKFKNYWKLLGIKNEIKCVVGRLDTWKSLKRSIIANGIVLYGKYIETPKEYMLLSILDWGIIKPESKRVLLNKRLFGYNRKKKFYKGLLQKSSGIKLDNSIMVPTEHLKDVLKVFRDMKITVEIRNVYEY